MKKQDIFAAFIIGEACAIIFLLVLRVLELPAVVVDVAQFFPVALPVLSIGGIWIVSSLFEKRMPAFVQMGKSFLVGILNSFIDLGILNFLMWFFKVSRGLPFTLFKGLSFSVSVVNSYIWNKFWAFEKKETRPGPKEFFQFFSVATGGFLINVVVSSVLVNIVGPQFGISEQIWANIGAIAAILCGFFWNFFGYKLLVFKK
jgi:putative flippase GtrA